MARHEQKDVTFDVPQGWEDRTVVAYASPKSADKTAITNFVMTRDTLSPGETMQTYADRQLAEIAKRLPAFELLDSVEVRLGGVPASQLLFCWDGANGPLVQRLTMVVLADKILTFTSTAPKNLADQMAPHFDAILASVRFPGAPAP